MLVWLLANFCGSDRSIIIFFLYLLEYSSWTYVMYVSLSLSLIPKSKERFASTNYIEVLLTC